MVNALGQVLTAGTPAHDKEKECRGSMVFECHSRKATPEELERYFGGKDKIQPAPAEPPKAKTISKDELLERLHPTHKEPETREPEESVPDESEISALNDIVAAAHKVSEKKYKAMKAAVIAIGLANGWE